MADALRTLFVLILTFALTALATWIAFQITRGKRFAKLKPFDCAKAKIKCNSGVFKTRFSMVSANEWWIHAPLEKGEIVPLRVGEEMILETVGSSGRLLFRTTIVERNGEQKLLKVAIPELIHTANRRTEERKNIFVGKMVEVEGRELSVVDVSETGLCAKSSKPFIPGDWVKIKLPNSKTLFAWVLANEFRGEDRVVRFRFEESINLP